MNDKVLLVDWYAVLPLTLAELKRLATFPEAEREDAEAVIRFEKAEAMLKRRGHVMVAINKAEG